MSTKSLCDCGQPRDHETCQWTPMRHYKRAGELLEDAEEIEADSEGDLSQFAADYYVRLVTAAQVHATLAGIAQPVEYRATVSSSKPVSADEIAGLLLTAAFKKHQ